MEQQQQDESSLGLRCDTIVQKLDELLIQELGAEDKDMLFARVIGTLMAKRKKYDRFTTENNDFKWMTDAYVAQIVGPLGEEFLKLHQFLVSVNATADNPHDFEHCDRYGAYFANDGWKSMALMTQNYTYMVVLQPYKVFFNDASGELQMRDSWAIHIRMCTSNQDSYNYSRLAFSALSFLGKFEKVYPEIGYGDKADPYFRYKDGRDRGFLCSVTPEMDGSGYRAVDSNWGPALSYLGGVLYDLGCHCSELKSMKGSSQNP